MPKIIRLKRGLDIRLRGEAVKKLTRLPLAATYALKPSDFPGVVPKLLVAPGEEVEAGTPLFFDKNRPRVLFCSPVAGRLSAVNRGEKRRILEVVVEAAPEQRYRTIDVPAAEAATKENVTEALLSSGLWPFIIQRPYGIIADPDDTPRAIFISGFDSAPLAPDMNYALGEEYINLRAGIEALKALTPGEVHLGIDADNPGLMDRLDGARQHWFRGPHPAGNVGVQINRVAPVNKGETVWTVDPQAVAMIGRLMRRGIADMRKVVAVTGSEVTGRQYFQILPGAPVASLVRTADLVPQEGAGSVRIVSGNVLAGEKVAHENYMGFYHNQLTVIPEGDHSEFVGWAMPGFSKFSVSRTFTSFLTPWRRYRLDTNLNGGHRPFVVTGLYDRYMPMDIYPMYLLKAILAGDIEKMEHLGIYEVVEEDFALCEFVDPSKTEMQRIVREGINLMIKELS